MVDVSAAPAQQPGRIYKIAWLHPGSAGGVPPPFEKWTGMGGAFRDALRERGFAVGKNLVRVDGVSLDLTDDGPLLTINEITIADH
jgi:hypothetical protein